VISTAVFVPLAFLGPPFHPGKKTMSVTTLPIPQTVPFLDIIQAAILAPSPDNNQPWRFAVDEGQLLVYLDPQRSLPSDVNSMFDMIGLGAAIENACIAARQLGLEPSVEYATGSLAAIQAGSEPAARITFHPGGQPDPLFPHLTTRCTCRRLYSTRSVAEDCLERLAEAAREFQDLQMDWICDRPRIRAFARLIANSDRIRFEYEPFHNELFQQLRFSADEAEQTRDGLDVRTLELPPGAAVLFRQLRPWNRMKWVHRLGLGRLLTVPSALSVWRSGAIGLLSVSEPTSRQWLDGGRAFQRLWLAAQAEGVSLQPLGSLPIFFAHAEQYEGRKLTPKHHDRIVWLREWYSELVPAAARRVLLLSFRLGYSAPPSQRSLRRSAAEVATR
jgi:hypothetical protein